MMPLCLVSYVHRDLHKRSAARRFRHSIAGHLLVSDAMGPANVSVKLVPCRAIAWSTTGDRRQRIPLSAYALSCQIQHESTVTHTCESQFYQAETMYIFKPEQGPNNGETNWA
jgi:hypothetical protein